MRKKYMSILLKNIAGKLASTIHPFSCHIVVTRRCNLSCAYCNEYDKVSNPVPFDVMKERIEALANLKAAAVTCTGGEPLLHNDLEAIIYEIRNYGMIAGMITNGYLLTKERVHQLNDAGLQILQISIDNLVPDEVSYKSLKVLDQKLQLLADYAEFAVNVNSVLGISDERTLDAIEVTKRAVEYGFSNSVGILHDEKGAKKTISPKQFDAYKQITKISKSSIHRFNYWTFQRNLTLGKPNNWKCRAGARYLYICEHGLVHWCSQQRGYPGLPIAEYTIDDIRREFRTRKDCRPFCTLSCVHQASWLDKWRVRQHIPDPHSKQRLQIQKCSDETSKIQCSKQ